MPADKTLKKYNLSKRRHVTISFSEDATIGELEKAIVEAKAAGLTTDTGRLNIEAESDGYHSAYLSHIAIEGYVEKTEQELAQEVEELERRDKERKAFQAKQYREAQKLREAAEKREFQRLLKKYGPPKENTGLGVRN